MSAVLERTRGAEVWIETTGRPGTDVAASIGASAAAGIEPQDIFLIIDSNGEAESREARALVDSLGLGQLEADLPALNSRLERTDADVLVLVRGARVSSAAFGAITKFFERFAEMDAVYGDSNDVGGRDVLRPAFSPIRLRGSDYMGPVIGLRVSSLRRLGGISSGTTESIALALALRQDVAVGLLPEVLATSDSLVPSSNDAQLETVAESLPSSAVVEDFTRGIRRVRYPVQGEPLVSIVIPTRGGSAPIAGRERVLVVEAVRSILDASSYTNLEFVIVADADTPQTVREELALLCADRLSLVSWDEEFNFSAKMNRGAAVARGEYLLLLNDDVELISADWIETMLSLAQQPGVGIVGAQLYFEDSTLQHAGQIYAGGVAGHAAFGWTGGRDDALRSLSVDREVSGVTAACALISRSVYLEVGGFTLALPGNYNDVDLNMKIRATGRTAVFSPWVRLYHFESKSRDPRILPSDLETLQSRWLRRMQVEMYSRML